MKFITSCALLCFLLLALPAASLAQTSTPWPTALPATLTAVATRQAFALINPTEVAPCGLPVRSAGLSTGSFTWTMTGDCVIRDSQIHSDTRFGVTAFMAFTGGGPYTINGNGYSIIGPSNAALFHIANGVILNLNNVSIRSAGSDQHPVIHVIPGAGESRLNAENVGFYNNRALAVIIAEGTETLSTHVSLTNARFLGNRVDQGVVRSAGDPRNPNPNTITINQAEFQDNRIEGDDVLSIPSGNLTLSGRIAFHVNPSASLGRANPYTVNTGALTDTDAVILIIHPKKKEKVPTATPTPRPLAVTCPALSQATGIAVSATYGLTSGIQCQRLNGAGIGVQSIIDAGFIDAVDIWGYVVQGVEVCFPQAGRILFLDARTIPRAITPLESTVVNGMTCASISSPGSLVLMPN